MSINVKKFISKKYRKDLFPFGFQNLINLTVFDIVSWYWVWDDGKRSNIISCIEIFVEKGIFLKKIHMETLNYNFLIYRRFSSFANTNRWQNSLFLFASQWWNPRFSASKLRNLLFFPQLIKSICYSLHLIEEISNFFYDRLMKFAFSSAPFDEIHHFNSPAFEKFCQSADLFVIIVWWNLRFFAWPMDDILFLSATDWRNDFLHLSTAEIHW